MGPLGKKTRPIAKARQWPTVPGPIMLLKSSYLVSLGFFYMEAVHRTPA